jgi:hypothetical protein
MNYHERKYITLSLSSQGLRLDYNHAGSRHGHQCSMHSFIDLFKEYDSTLLVLLEVWLQAFLLCRVLSFIHNCSAL